MSRHERYDLQARYDKLHEAACCVANAINAGVGGHIRGSLMEKEFRDALGLKPGEWAPADKASESQS